MAKEENMENIALDWVQLHNELSKRDESTKDKMMRKMKENPFVPIGVLATTAALGYGLVSFRRGNRQMSQYMMRARIAAQGFTVVALLVGLGMAANKR